MAFLKIIYINDDAPVKREKNNISFTIPGRSIPTRRHGGTGAVKGHSYHSMEPPPILKGMS